MARPKGSLNRKTAEKIEAIEASGETPLQYMLRVMRDDTQDAARRDDMARAAAPYVHAKLASAEVEHKGGISLIVKLDDRDAVVF